MDLNFLMGFGVLFVIGTFILYRSKNERHFIIFLIRTKHFLKFINSISRISPRFWNFFADLAIFISFSGLGAAYLSRYRKLSKNLDIILLVFGGFAILIWSNSWLIFILMMIILFIGIKSLNRIKNPVSDFIVSTLFISLIWLKVVIWYIAILEGMFGLLVFIFGPLIMHAFDIAAGKTSIPGVSPIVPGSEGGRIGFVVPGMNVFIPLGYGLVAIIILLVVHEFSHGILARTNEIRLKSTGLLTLGPVPVGAFVEPDEEKFQRSESIKKMRVLAVGSISNIFTAVLCLIIFIFLIIPSNGLIVEKSTIEEIPPRTRIEMVNNIIISLDAISATMANYVFTENFYNLAELVGNESTVNLTTDKGIFTLDSEKISGLTLVYVPKFRYNVEIMGTNLFLVLAGILFWAYFFNLNVGLVNLLPIAPFDGGKMVMELISMFSPNETILKRITYAILLVGIIIILINALPLVNMALDYISGIDYSSFLPI